MATRKIYKRFGLRRDRSLTDLSNSTEALNNLLDALVDNEESTFVSQDLNSLRGVFSLGLSSNDYRNIIGSTIVFSDQNGVTKPVVPKITYKNRLDRFGLFAGEPQISGGNGLTASYFNKDQVNVDTIGIFTGSPFKTDNFWEQGRFDYSGKISPESLDVNGGVQWEGYYIPTENGSHVFTIYSSANFTFDFESEGYQSGIGTYLEVSRIGISSILQASAIGGTNLLTLSNVADTKFIGIGQSVICSGISTGTEVESFDRNSGEITLFNPQGTTVESNLSGVDVDFRSEIGDNTEISYATQVLSAYKKYHIRLRYYIPKDEDAITKQRYFRIRVDTPSESRDYLRFTELYSLDYDFNSQGDFITFTNDSILYGGGELGSTTDPNSYVKVTSDKKIDITYQPKSTLAEITKGSYSGNVTLGSEILYLNNTTDLEVGNYVFGDGIPENTRIANIGINQFVGLTKNASSTASGTYIFIDHRGFVKRCIGSGSSGTFTMSSGNTNDLRSGMVIIGSGVQSYTGITTVGNPSIIQISPSQTISGSTAVYFYQSKGLINDSLNKFCVPSQTKCLTVSQNVGLGTNIIPVENANNVANNWTVQGYYFAEDTKIIGNPGTGNEIEISKNTIRNISEGSTFTVTDRSDDRSLCCPPTDTSPPFNATLFGLETVEDSPTLKINTGDLKFDQLDLSVSQNNITNYVTGEQSSKTITLKTPTGDFKLLGS